MPRSHAIPRLDKTKYLFLSVAIAGAAHAQLVVSLSSSLPSCQPVGTAANFTASATGATGTTVISEWEFRTRCRYTSGNCRSRLRRHHGYRGGENGFFDLEWELHGARRGGAVPVTISVAGANSNTVTMAVQ